MLATTGVKSVIIRYIPDREQVRQSVLIVRSPDSYSGETPIESGLFDLRMGTVDHLFRCATCKLDKKECYGHSGHIVLPIKLLDPIMRDEIKKWLKITCHFCDALLVTMKGLPASNRFNLISKQNFTGRACPVCSRIQPKITKNEEDDFSIKATFGPIETVLTSEFIKNRLRGISSSLLTLMGKHLDVHPSEFCRNIIQIPPNTMRPGARIIDSATQRSQHNIQTVLQYILKGSIQMANPQNRTYEAKSNMHQLYYQMHLGKAGATVSSRTGKRRLTSPAEKPIEGTLRGIPSKHGFLRSKLLGKRVIWAARSTISGNTKLELDQVGVPLKFAKSMQVIETMQKFNADRLLLYFMNGRHNYPGCTRILKKNTGAIYDVENNDINFRLEIGDMLYRDLVDGDYVYFNRQPTLERNSIGLHRAKILLYGCLTLQLNVSSCKWYGADFDGDEMNISAPKYADTRAEAITLSNVADQFISIKSSGPLIGQVQDGIISLFDMSKGRTRMNKRAAMTILQDIGIVTPPLKGDGSTIYTGRDILSHIMSIYPFNYRRSSVYSNELYKNNIKYDKDNVFTEIRNGKLISGVLDKKSLGAGVFGSIYQRIAHRYGSSVALKMVYVMQQAGLQFKLFDGATVSLDDMLLNKNITQKIHDEVNLVLHDSELLTDKLIYSEIIPPMETTVHDYYEDQQISNALVLNDDELMRYILSSIDPETNGLFKMILSGSKGIIANLRNIQGSIGQLTINTERLAETFSFRRTMPYFPRYSTDPGAYGFVANSYINGINNIEFVSGAMQSRFDLISKALSTSVTGAFMRRCVMAIQSVIVTCLRHVKAGRKVNQLLYGDDGADSQKMEHVNIHVVSLSDSDLQKETCGKHVCKGYLHELKKLIDWYRYNIIKLESTNFESLSISDVLMPINPVRIINDVVTETKKEQSIGLQDKIDAVFRLIGKISYVLLNPIQEKHNRTIPDHLFEASKLLKLGVLSALNPIFLTSISMSDLKNISDRILLEYSSSLIAYGTACGILAAQAVCEPLTQYMLDSHHRSISGGTNTAGVRRINEIFGAKVVEAEESPKMLIPLQELNDPDEVSILATSLEFLPFKQFLSRYDILYESEKNLRYKPFLSDAAWIKEFIHDNPLVVPSSDTTNWCYRFVIQKGVMVHKAIYMQELIEGLLKFMPEAYILYTPETSETLIIRVYLSTESVKKDMLTEIEGLLDKLLMAPIRGIKGVKNASIKRISRLSVGSDGSMSSKDIMVLSTRGTNLYQAALIKGIDQRNFITSSVDETNLMFGIEAARQKIINESKNIADSPPNIRHLQIYADRLTATGRITSIELGGIKTREPTNVLLAMGTASPIKSLINAATNSVENELYDSIAPLLIGAIPRVGSAYSTLIVNEKIIKANVRTATNILDDL